MRLLNCLEEIRLVYNVVYACFLYQYDDVLCLVLLFVCCECVKRKKEGLKVGLKWQKYVQK